MKELKGQEKVEISEVYSPYRVYWEIDHTLADLITRNYTFKPVMFKGGTFPTRTVFLKTAELIAAANDMCKDYRCFYSVTKVVEKNFEDPLWRNENKYYGY